MAKLSEDTVIYNSRPAELGFKDASVVGGGHVWAMLTGAISNEQVLLYRDDLKRGGYTGVLQDVSDKFPLVRKLYAEGKIIDAEKLLQNEFSKKGYNPQVENPVPMATLHFDFQSGGCVTDYCRITDMADGEVEISFKHGDTQVKRGCFVARGSDIFAYNTECKGGNMTFSIGPYDNLQNISLSFEGGYAYFSARSVNGLDYGLVARVVAANLRHDVTGIVVKNSDSITVYVATFNNSNRDAEFKKLKGELGNIKSYEKLLAAHTPAHRKLFDSFTLSLGGGDIKDDFALQLSDVYNAKIHSGLVTRLWNLGKYLMICGVSPKNLSFFNSFQLMYCGSMSEILPPMVLNLLDYFEKYVDDLRKNATRVYGMHGYFVPNVTSPESALFGAVNSATVHFIASGALAADLFYRYYLLTGDVKTLKSRIFPFMREICNFYSDFLKLDQNGRYTTIPSYSPMSTPGNIIAGKPLENFGFAVNSTIDFLAVDHLLDNLIDIAGICGGLEDVSMWQDMKTKLPPYTVNDAGCLREYTNSAFIDGQVNCGTMHAYGLWPLKSISFLDKEVIYKPAVAVGAASREQMIGLRRASFNAMSSRLELSGIKQDARSLTVGALQAAHAGLGDLSVNKTYEILLKLLMSCFTPSGLCMDADWRGSGFTKNGGEFDVVGNIGFTNTVTECLMQSNSNTLRILPNVFDSLAAGEVSGLLTDFALKVSISWDIGKRRCTVKILPKINCKINVEISKYFRKVKGYQFDTEINGIKDVSLFAGRGLVLEFN